MSISYTQKLKTTFGELTYSEEKLAQYIDEHRSEMTDITSQQLAAEVGIGQSTVIRFSQKLGYGTFKKMIADITSENPDESIDLEIEEHESTRETNEKIREQYNQILDLTIFNKVMAAQGFTEKEYMALQGIYTGKYNTLINVPLAMANGLAASIIPSMTTAVAVHDKNQIHEKISQSIRFTMIIAIPCFIGFIVLGSPLMVLLYNDTSKTPATLLAVGSITVVLYCWSTVSNSILQGLDKLSKPAKNAGISLVIHLIALFIMLVVLKWNIYALVGSNIVFAICMCLLNARAIHKACDYRQEIDNTFVKPLIAALIMGAVTYLVHFIFDLLIGGRFTATFIAILFAVIVYALALLKLGTLSNDDIRALPQGDKILHICKKFHLLPKYRML